MPELAKAIRSVLLLKYVQAPFRTWPKLRMLILIIGLIAIPIWQASFFNARDDLDVEYRIRKSYGASHQFQFAYFFYTLDLYPVSSWGSEKELSENAAMHILHGNSAKYYLGPSWERVGVYFLFPHYLIGGDVRKPTFVPANAIGLTLALTALFIGFWVVRQEVLGSMLVVMIGSNPMLLAETYAINNIFAWTMITGLIVFSLHLPFISAHRHFLLVRRPVWRRVYLWSAPILTGVILGTMVNVRVPAVMSIFAVLIIYAFHLGFTLPKRATLISLMCGVFLLTATGWNLYFDHIAQSSIEKLETAGGGLPDPYWRFKKQHPVWHSMSTGLGDFDDKYGYLWDDAASTSYATSVLERKLDYTDSISVYLAPYYNVIRDRILSDIFTDPMWYIRILSKRIWTAVFENTPPTVSFGSHRFNIPFGGIVFAVPVCLLFILAVYCRAWPTIAGIIFLASAGATAIIVTTSAGYKYVMFIHLFFYALIPLIALELLLRITNRCFRE